MIETVLTSLLAASFISLLAPPGAAQEQPQPAGRTFVPFMIAVVADPQIGMVEVERDEYNFTRVSESANERKPDLVLIAGDLVEHAGDANEISRYKAVLAKFKMPVHAVPGNHDLGNDPMALAQRLDSYAKAVGPDRFRVEHKGCLFVGMNSQLWALGTAHAEQQFAWLKAQLADTKGYRHVFLVQHHPLFLKDPEEPDAYFNTPRAWREKLLALIEEKSISAVFTGHFHRNLSGSYRRTHLITTPSPVRNFDAIPFGYRLINVHADGLTESYVPVSGMRPDEGPASPSRTPTRTPMPDHR